MKANNRQAQRSEAATQRVLDTALKLVAWTFVLGALLAWIYRRSLEALTVNGG